MTGRLRLSISLSLLMLLGACRCTNGAVAVDQGADVVAARDSGVDADGHGSKRDGPANDAKRPRCISRADAAPVPGRDKPIVARRGLAWTTPVGASEGTKPLSPAAFAGGVAVGVRATGIVAVDKAGKKAWATTIAPSLAADFDTEVFPRGDTLVYERPGGAIRLLDAKGKQQWEQAKLGPFTDGLAVGHFSAMLRLSDGSVIVATSGPNLLRVHAGGAVAWSRPMPGLVTALLRDGKDGVYALASGLSGAYVLALSKEGEEFWRTALFNGEVDARSRSAAVAANGVVYLAASRVVSGEDKHLLLALRPECGRVSEVAPLPCQPLLQPPMLVDDKNHAIVTMTCSGGSKEVRRVTPQGTISWFIRAKWYENIASVGPLGSDGKLYLMQNFYDETTKKKTARLSEVNVDTGKPSTLHAFPGGQFSNGDAVLLDGGLLVMPMRGTPSTLVGYRVSSPRLMQAGWPRRGGSNSAAFAF